MYFTSIKCIECCSDNVDRYSHHKKIWKNTTGWTRFFRLYESNANALGLASPGLEGCDCLSLFGRFLFHRLIDGFVIWGRLYQQAIAFHGWFAPARCIAGFCGDAGSKAVSAWPLPCAKGNSKSCAMVDHLQLWDCFSDKNPTFFLMVCLVGHQAPESNMCISLSHIAICLPYVIFCHSWNPRCRWDSDKHGQLIHSEAQKRMVQSWVFSPFSKFQSLPSFTRVNQVGFFWASVLTWHRVSVLAGAPWRHWVGMCHLLFSVQFLGACRAEDKRWTRLRVFQLIEVWLAFKWAPKHAHFVVTFLFRSTRC